jgi:NADH-quinone oxidoreductase subunit A
MTTLVTVVILFIIAGLGFLFFNLFVGWFLRPRRPSPEKATIYECGETTIGSAWIQFDLRFYVVALLFVIFDVEVAFFFPWATVFGTANNIAAESATVEQRQALSDSLQPTTHSIAPATIDPAVASEFAWIAFIDIAIFFSILLVGFAYLWRRGDLEWVRSMAAQR